MTTVKYSLDEFISIHEWASQWFDLGGVLYFSWVIPAAVLVALLGLAYLPFLAHMQPQVRKRFLLAATVYVGGALGMELPLGYWVQALDSGIHWLWAITIVVSIMHFWYDGFVWSVRRNQV